ncbi:MAG: hypothetical protein LBS83_03000 [Holosporales bacterium]|nr:hypothetical protein [Holosporales bacterium]
MKPISSGKVEGAYEAQSRSVLDIPNGCETQSEFSSDSAGLEDDGSRILLRIGIYAGAPKECGF